MAERCEGLDLARAFGAAATSRAAVWEFVKAFAGSWTVPLSPADGIPPSEVRRAEERLGYPLPAVLSEAYALFGRRADLVAVHNLFLAQDEPTMSVTEPGTDGTTPPTAPQAHVLTNPVPPVPRPLDTGHRVPDGGQAGRTTDGRGAPTRPHGGGSPTGESPGHSGERPGHLAGSLGKTPACQPSCPHPNSVACPSAPQSHVQWNTAYLPSLNTRGPPCASCDLSSPPSLPSRSVRRPFRRTPRPQAVRPKPAAAGANGSTGIFRTSPAAALSVPRYR